MHPLIVDVLVCSDDEKAKQVASELVGKIQGARALKWRKKLENARIVESLTGATDRIEICGYKVHGAGIAIHRAALEVRPLLSLIFQGTFSDNAANHAHAKPLEGPRGAAVVSYPFRFSIRARGPSDGPCRRPRKSFNGDMRPLLQGGCKFLVPAPGPMQADR